MVMGVDVYKSSSENSDILVERSKCPRSVCVGSPIKCGTSGPRAGPKEFFEVGSFIGRMRLLTVCLGAYLTHIKTNNAQKTTNSMGMTVSLYGVGTASIRPVR